MNEVIPFAFEEQLIRATHRDGEPWFIGRDVCRVLHLANESKTLASLDPDERVDGVAISDPMGREQRVIIVSEPGVYRLVFRSRKPEAERFKRWLAHDVLPKLRRDGSFVHNSGGIGHNSGAGEPSSERLTEADLRAAPLLHRLNCIREIRAIAGRAAARTMWNRLGLPALPPPPPTALDEARQCLRHLLDFTLPNGALVRRTILAALDEDIEAQALLLGVGVRALPDHDAFLVANRHPGLEQVYRGSEWDACGHVSVLRRLPGTEAGLQSRFGGAVQRRGTMMPSRLLDDGA